jgi:Protein of unknown function (DUF3025)
VRYRAPPREAIDSAVFDRLPLSAWSDHFSLLQGEVWPSIEQLNRALPSDAEYHFAAQTPALLADGLHYEQRIAERGEIATRENNWHDLLNALIWLRYAELKSALNARQAAEISRVGAKQRSRPQCALTHFDEAGIVVHMRDERLLALWDAHDWHGLFWRERDAWSGGRIGVVVFGHALLEHALKPEQLLVGKALVVIPQSGNGEISTLSVAAAIRDGDVLNDPQELRPLPLSGIPGWHADNEREDFYRSAPCFCPVREGRRYPPPLSPPSLSTVDPS